MWEVIAAIACDLPRNAATSYQSLNPAIAIVDNSVTGVFTGAMTSNVRSGNLSAQVFVAVMNFTLMTIPKHADYNKI